MSDFNDYERANVIDALADFAQMLGFRAELIQRLHDDLYAKGDWTDLGTGSAPKSAGTPADQGERVDEDGTLRVHFRDGFNGAYVLTCGCVSSFNADAISGTFKVGDYMRCSDHSAPSGEHDPDNGDPILDRDQRITHIAVLVDSPDDAER